MDRTIQAVSDLAAARVAGFILPMNAGKFATVVYILRGSSGRHYIGMTNNLERRLAEHRAGHTHTTQRLGANLIVVASKVYSSCEEAAAVERQLKSWKNPGKAVVYLTSPG